MNKLKVCKPTAKHVAFVAGNLRLSDLEELRALGVTGPPQDALQQCVEFSFLCWTMFYKDNPVAITGVIPQARFEGSSPFTGIGTDTGKGKDTAAPWLVGTGSIDLCPVAFMRTSRWAIGEYLNFFKRLSNIVYARQVKSLRYLKALGFTIDTPRTFANGTFHTFHMEAK